MNKVPILAPMVILLILVLCSQKLNYTIRIADIEEIIQRRLAIIISSAKGFIFVFLQKNEYINKIVARFDIQKMEMYKIN